MPEKPWTPPGYISVGDAFDRLGRKMFKGKWTGTEISARPEHLERKDEARKKEERKPQKAREARKASAGVRSGPKPYQKPPIIRPTFTVEERQEELNSRRRFDAVFNEMRTAIYDENLPYGRRSDGGGLTPGDPNIWGRADAESTLKSMGAFDTTAEPWLLVPEAQMRQLIEGTLRNEPKVEQPEATGDSLPANQHKYSTEFLDLVKQAIEHFKISDDNQPPIKQLVEWFKKQKSDGAPVSARMASSMATAARRLEMRKGGYHRSDRASKSAK